MAGSRFQSQTTTPQTDPLGGHARRNETYYLVRFYSPVPGEPVSVYPLGGTATIGRSPEGPPGHIPIEDTKASRRHASLRRCSPGPYAIQDLDSRNGTFVNGTQVESGRVDEGDVLRIGDTLFVLREWSLPPEPDPALEREDCIGFSPGWQTVLSACTEAARWKYPPLLVGETGTGKEVLANQIHRRSGRKGPFVPVNCGSLSPSLVGSLLFGHRKGAFTGADRGFDGFARAAHRGTLFLDELGELPMESQASLLRFLESRETTPLGETKSMTLDVLVVSATNRDINRAMAEGTLRRDLCARHRVIPIPPLRDRPEDVVRLLCAGSEPVRLTPDAAETLALHGWPENVREVLKFKESIRATIGDREAISLPDLPAPLRNSVFPRARRETSVQGETPRPTRAELEKLFEECGGNVSEMARRLGVYRAQVYRFLKYAGVRAADSVNENGGPS